MKDVFSLRELAERFGAAPAAIANALRRNKLDRAPAPSGPRVHRSPTWRQAADQAMQIVEEPTSTVAAPAAAPAAASPAAAELVTTRSTTPKSPPIVPSGRASELRGYRVVIDQQAYIVVAPDLAQAAALATTSGRGDVSSLELLGFALAS